jgi:hypothetical protein
LISALEKPTLVGVVEEASEVLKFGNAFLAKEM